MKLLIALALTVCAGCNAPTVCSTPACADMTIAGKRLFKTNHTVSGDLATDTRGAAAGAAAGDLLCGEAADGAGLGGVWRAFISTSTERSVDRIADVGPWYLLDGEMAFRSKQDFQYGPLTTLDRNEKGVHINGTTWTGARGVTCGDWTSSSNIETGGFGAGLAADPNWAGDGGGTFRSQCSSPHSLFCFEQ